MWSSRSAHGSARFPRGSRVYVRACRTHSIARLLYWPPCRSRTPPTQRPCGGGMVTRWLQCRATDVGGRVRFVRDSRIPAPFFQQWDSMETSCPTQSVPSPNKGGYKSSVSAFVPTFFDGTTTCERQKANAEMLTRRGVRTRTMLVVGFPGLQYP